MHRRAAAPTAPTPSRFTLEAATAQDFEALHSLRLRAMRESLERLGRYDERRSRERLAEGFVPAHTQHIVVDGQRIGFLVLRRLSHSLRLNHLYIEPAHARQGLGSAVLGWVLAQADAAQLPVELVALKGSDANRFYQRHGFVCTGEGPWDIDYLRPPVTPALSAVRAMWAALQARDWAAARALLRDDLQSTWWTSGEHYASADGYIAMQAAYPEGWTILLKEAVRVDDGRVLTVTRVDHPPHHFFATALFRVDDGLIAGIDEYWSTLETPPAWRRPERFSGLTRFDPLADPQAREP
ncbi:MAG: GNAT family N-acetyltransferase [Rubrivivax sp.]|nr:GNAT family N-acetyltransferase [Rubrivivax sp.]